MPPLESLSPSSLTLPQHQLQQSHSLSKAAKQLGSYGQVTKSIRELESILESKNTSAAFSTIIVVISTLESIGFIRQSEIDHLKRILRHSTFNRVADTLGIWKKLMAWEAKPKRHQSSAIPAFTGVADLPKLPPQAKVTASELKKRVSSSKIDASLLYDFKQLERSSATDITYAKAKSKLVAQTQGSSQNKLFYEQVFSIAKDQEIISSIEIDKAIIHIHEKKVNREEKEQGFWRKYLHSKIVGKVLRVLGYAVAPFSSLISLAVVTTSYAFSSLGSVAQTGQGVFQRVLGKISDAKMTVSRALSNITADIIFTAFLWTAEKALGFIGAGLFIVADILGIIKLGQDIAKNAKEIKALAKKGQLNAVKGDRLWFLKRDNFGQMLGIASRVATIAGNAILIGLLSGTGAVGFSALVGTPPGQAVLGLAGVGIGLYLSWAWIRLHAKNEHVEWKKLDEVSAA